MRMLIAPILLLAPLAVSASSVSYDDEYTELTRSEPQLDWPTVPLKTSSVVGASALAFTAVNEVSAPSSPQDDENGADTGGFRQVPLPVAAWLLPSGLGGLIAFARRRPQTAATI